ncbi:MAG: protein-disulfide reductase DsbD domain-containing protein, partial [Pseudomonadota bacterium]
MNYVTNKILRQPKSLNRGNSFNQSNYAKSHIVVMQDNRANILITSMIMLAIIAIAILSMIPNSKANDFNPYIIDHEQAKLEFNIASQDLDHPLNKGHLTTIINFKIIEKWHIYWHKAGDTGSPLTLNITQEEASQKNGSAQNSIQHHILWPTPKRYITKFGENDFFQNFIYENNVTLPILITQPINYDLPLNIKLDYTICYEICIPKTDEISLKLNDPELINNQKIAEALYQIPQLHAASQTGSKEALQTVSEAALQAESQAESQTKSPTESATKISLIKFNDKNNNPNLYIKIANIKTPKNHMLDDIFIDSDLFARFHAPIFIKDKSDTAYIKVEYHDLTKITEIAGNAIFSLQKNNANIETKPHLNNLENQDFQIAFSSTEIQEIDNPFAEEIIVIEKLLLMMLYAMIGGFILNLMPCVLPVLSIKLIGFIDHSGESITQIRIKFLLSSLGIIVSFMILAFFTIFLKYTGESVGWGIQFQNPSFIIILILMLVFFITNLSNQISFNIPSKLATKIATINDKTYIGNFFTGVFATLLATPCTAPFLGIAVGFAIANNNITILLIFLAMAFGMALP